MNLELMEAAEDEAMHASRFMNFCTKADIVHPTEKNARQVEKKCRAAAVEAADEIIDENRAKACAASSKTVEFEQGGEMHTAAVVAVAQDGSALKRDYGHCYTGSAAAKMDSMQLTGSSRATLRVSAPMSTKRARATASAFEQPCETEARKTTRTMCTRRTGP